MDNKKSRFIIAFVLEGQVALLHQKLVDDVSPKFKLRKINTPSHITLKDSFYCTETTEIENVIQEVMSNISVRGNVIIDGISNFRNEIFFIDARLDDNSKKIYKNLLNRLREIQSLQWDQFDTLEREFHLTITNKANSENFNDIKKYLSQFHPHFKVPFDNISILKKLDKEHRWIIHKQFTKKQ